MNAFTQDGYGLKLGWGLTEARALTYGRGRQLVVIVDVLTFTTTLSVAMDVGARVWPYPWVDPAAERFAARHGADLAVPRSNAAAGAITLSPDSVRSASGLRRLVLPSPNGATISQALDHRHLTVLGASLRNFSAVARFVTAKLRQQPEVALVVVAAGEHWEDGSLRPAVEDLWGAGAVLSAVFADLDTAGGNLALPSPEARVAAAAFEDVRGDVAHMLMQCGSGRELAEMGYAGDVEVAGEVGASTSVPLLVDGAFVDAQ